MSRSFFGRQWIVVMFCLATTATFAQSTAFTYQGRLTVGGALTNALYDLRFSIFNSVASGSQVAGTITNASTPVSNGLFTVTLDFGTNAFTGADRWLEIGVRPGGGAGAFTLLSPRQRITAAPYAILAQTAAGVQGTLPYASLPATVVRSDAGQTFSAPQVIAPVGAGNQSALLIQGNPAGNTNLLEIQSALNSRVLSVTGDGKLSLGRDGSQADALLHFGKSSLGVGDHINFMKFDAFDYDTNNTGGWVFGQGVGDNPAPDTDKSKNWFWGFNHDPTKPFGKQSPNEPQLFWNMECNWDPWGGVPNGQRQMEYYLVYGSRSNTLGMRPFSLLLRDDAYVEAAFVPDVFALHGIGGVNDSAVHFDIARSTNGGANLTIRGNVFATTNVSGGGAFYAFGGGYSALSPDGSFGSEWHVDTDGSTRFSAQGTTLGKPLVIESFANTIFATPVWLLDGGRTNSAIGPSRAAGNDGISFGNNLMAFNLGQSTQGEFDSDGFSLHPGNYLAWASSATFASRDLFLSRHSPAVLQMGKESGTPVTQTFKSGDANGVDKAGSDLVIAGGQSTGTNYGGTIYFATSGTNATGSALNNLVRRMAVLPSGTVTFSNGFWVANSINNAPGTSLTADKPAGVVTIPAGQVYCFVTNSLITTNTIVLATVNTDDVNVTGCAAVPIGGLLTLKLNNSPAGNVRVSWAIFNVGQ